MPGSRIPTRTRGERTSWISPALALARAQCIRDVRYQLDLRIDADARSLAGHSRIAFVLDACRTQAELVLDWRPQCGAQALARSRASLRVNGVPVQSASVRIGGGHIVIASRSLRTGANCIELDWVAPIRAAASALTRYRDPDDGSLYVYTLFVPADASTVFPCFDQPDLKARFGLTLVLPAAWRALANAPPARVESSPRGLRVTRFATTEPISTYAFAFAAGPFVALRSDAGGALWVRRSQARRARPHRDEILALNARAVRYFARYFGHRFPFAKYDLVAIPDLPYRGMEHAGATFLAEKDLFPPVPGSLAARWERAQLLFHECAHQWAGDLVTMRSFDDLWLKEGFANFMAYKLGARVFASGIAAVAFHRLKVQACHTDESAGATALHHPLPDMAAAKSAYGTIVYAKAPALLRQLEFMLGAARFRAGVRAWVRRHAYGAADWRDLVAALEAAGGVSLARFAAAWIVRPGVPRLHAGIRNEGTGASIVVAQSAAEGLRRTWPLAFRIAIEGMDGRVDSRVVGLDSATTRLTLRRGRGSITAIALNAGDEAYAIVACEPERAEATAEAIRRSSAPLRRVQLWETLWQAVRDATLDPARFVTLALGHLGTERNGMITAAVLERVQLAMDRFLGAERRNGIAQCVDAFLVRQARARGAEEARPWLEGLIAVAGSSAGLEWLERLALGRPLARGTVTPRLRVRAALMAVVRGAWGASQATRAIALAGVSGATLRLQLAAARPDERAKQQVAERLRRDTSLADEAILACLEYLNHPAHAPVTVALVPSALRCLPVLERQRKIFFVNRWIGAFVAGQHSAAARDAVRRALTRPQLGEPLRRKLLEAEHELGIVVRSRRRWTVGA
jgi:aminopeptidase N